MKIKNQRSDVSTRCRIGVVLTSKPSHGGKFKYGLAIVKALASLETTKYDLYALIGNPFSWRELDDLARFSVFAFHHSTLNRVVRRIVLSLPGGLSIWRFVGRYLDPLHRLLHRCRLDLVLYPAGIDVFSYECSVPSVVPVHDLMHRYEAQFPEVREKGLFRIKERHYRRICAYAQGILVDSELGREQLMENYRVAGDKIFTLPYIPTEFQRVTPLSQVRSKFNIPRRFLFYPSQFWLHKNHSGLLKALAILRDKGIIVPLVLVGSEKNAKLSTIRLAEELNLNTQVYIYDYVSDEDLAGLYRAATALVMPTFFGPTNIPPLEAFSLGCPVIVSQVYGMPEQVGNAALLIDPHDPADLADAIRRVWEDSGLRRLLRLRGQRKAKDWNQLHFNGRLEEVLKKLVVKQMTQ